MFKSGSTFNVLYTENLERTRDFYQSIGAEIKKFEEDKIVVGVAEFDLHIILASTEPHQDYKFMANSLQKGGSVIFYCEVENIEEIYSKVKSTSGRLRSEIYNNHWGAREFLCEDPSGYKFAFYQMI